MQILMKRVLAVVAVAGTGLAALSAADAATLNIVGCERFTGDITSGTITCVTSSTTTPSPGAPSGCTASVSPTSLLATGGEVRLATASCTSTTTFTTKLKRDGALVNTPDVLPSNLSSAIKNYTYTVQFCAANEGPCSSDVPAGTVSVAAGQVASNTCDGLKVITPTHSGTATPELTIGKSGYRTSGFDNSESVVIAALTSSGRSGRVVVSVYNYPGDLRSKSVWMSTNRCDFSTAASIGKTPNIVVQFGGTDPKDGYTVFAQSTDTLYLRVKNVSWGNAPTCPVGTDCNIGIDVSNLK